MVNWQENRAPTAFGAVWDSETDAFFILILSAYAYLNSEHSLWILLPGMMRYLFYFPFLYLKPEGFKFPRALSLYSKTVCVITVLAYAALYLPLPGIMHQSIMIAITLALVASFLWEAVTYVLLKVKALY